MPLWSERNAEEDTAFQPDFQMTAGKELTAILIAAVYAMSAPSHSQQQGLTKPQLPQIKLAGTVLSSSPSQSIALVSVDGRAQALYRVGSAITHDWLLAAASVDEILIRSRDGRTARVLISAEEAVAAPLLAATAPPPATAAKALPQRSPNFPTPEMVEAAINEFDSPAND